MRFDLTDLRLFLLVVEAGSMTHGAERANLSLPAASERLRGMEEASGIELLERSRRGVVPTQAGEALAHHARLILRQIEQMQGELGEYSKGLKATIRLLANTAAMTELLPEALAPWLASHPQIDIDLKERQSFEIVKSVAGGLAEIGVMSGAVDPGALELLPFGIDRLVLVVARDHSLAALKQIGFAEVLHHDFLGLSIGSALQDHINEQAARLGQPLKFRARLRSFDGICQMVARGVGLGIVPDTAFRRYRRSMAIAALRLSDPWATRRLSVCFRNMAELSPFARNLVTYLNGRTAPKD
ncbi:MAG: LysR substrate-binding domain-containing protein [Dongiaceae bacterium]